MKIDNIYNIKINGPYVCMVYDDKEKTYKQLGDLFMYADGNFYDKNGNGPWLDNDIQEIQKYVNLYNKTNIKCYFENYEKTINHR